MDASEMGDVLYGPEGFSYTPVVDPVKDEGRTLVRDASDDLLLEAQYRSGREEDIAVSFRSDVSEQQLKTVDAVGEDDFFYEDMPTDDLVGTVDVSDVDEWEKRRICSFEDGGFRYVFEDLESDVTSVRIKGSRDGLEGLVSRAAQALMELGDYTVESHFEDPYRNDVRPYDSAGDARGIKTVGKRNIIENVVETSLHLSGEVLEGEVEDWVE